MTRSPVRALLQSKWVYFHNIFIVSVFHLVEIVKRIRALTIKLLPLEVDRNALNDPTSVDGVSSQ